MQAVILDNMTDAFLTETKREYSMLSASSHR